jgi:hypothetical protein
LAPCQHSLIAKHAQGSAGGEMALDAESGRRRRGLRESAVLTLAKSLAILALTQFR